MAEAHCKGLGGHLVSIHSPEEHKFIADLGKKNDNETVWIGGSDYLEDEWVWSDGTPFGYTNWVEGQPNYKQDWEDCLSLCRKRGFKWNDAKCSNYRKFMCKIMYAKISFF